VHLKLGKFSVSLLYLFLKVVLHLVAIIHILHQLTEHKYFFFSLPVLEQFHLLGVSLQLKHFKLFLDCLFFISVENLNILLTFSLFNCDSLKCSSKLVQTNEVLVTLLSEELFLRLDFILQQFELHLLLSQKLKQESSECAGTLFKESIHQVHRLF